MQIHESGEDYLEAILMLQKKNDKVRSIDICSELGYSKPSVSVAMKHFRENGYVVMDDDFSIRLTEKGLSIAERIYERHVLIAQFLMSIGVPEKEAFEDACKIEHDLSPMSFQCLKEHFQKLSK